MTNRRDEEPQPLVVPLSLDGIEALTFDVGEPPEDPAQGWAAYHQGSAGAIGSVWVRVRFGPETFASDAPLGVRELQVTSTAGGAVFGSPLLRGIPFNRMTAAVNHPDRVAQIRALTGPANMVESGGGPADKRFVWTFPPQSPQPMAAPDLRIQDPGGRRKPDEFYDRITRIYLSAAILSNRPAQDMADANGLPVTTVHRWLKESRSRGFLRLPQPRRQQEDQHE